MKRVTTDAILSAVMFTSGASVGVAYVNGIFSSVAFQVSFGIVFATISTFIIGGTLVQRSERRALENLRKRIRVSVDAVGATVISIEKNPDEK